MKRKITGILLAGLLAFSGTGCTQNGGTVDTSSGSAGTVSDSSVDQSSGISAEEEQEAEMTLTPTPSEEQGDQRMQVSLPQKEGMQADYTSVEGIQLEAGSCLAVVAKDLSTGYWKAVKNGAQQALDDLNAALNYTGNDKITMTFEGTSDPTDAEDQSNTIDVVISENPAALCLGIIDMQTCKTQLEMAAESGIPVIIVDSGVDSDLFEAFCGIDNRAAGAEAAKKLCEAIGDTGQVAVASHQSTTQTSVERVEGFTNEITQNHPGVTIVQTCYSDGEEDLETSLGNMFQQYPQLEGIFCTNQEVSDLALSILDDQENPVKMVGFDYSEAQQTAIESGLEYGTISQNPYSLGYAMIVAAARAAAGMPVDSFVDAGYLWLDQSNIAAEDLELYRY